MRQTIKHHLHDETLKCLLLMAAHDYKVMRQFQVSFDNYAYEILRRIAKNPSLLESDNDSSRKD